MTAPIYPMLLMFAKLDAASRATVLSQIDRFVFASPSQRRALVDAWRHQAEGSGQRAHP
ncbi:hypothetical protein LMG7141_02590 [Ralstonia condita]|uniref:Uncharacterized protein n=2 Tax=Ralstonia condita TaxID=3058600 RepID=A0ABN9ITU5_9RALS|nr:hypothetical protein [Burkholderiaceae bacterium]CAJ0791988.1 hypothetical protein LMG7141_02590 [Ralstonia sp. LMG 7141]